MSMNMQQNAIYESLRAMENVLDKSFPILPNHLVAVKCRDLEPLIDRIYASIPMAIQEAQKLLQRRDEIQIEAQEKAERIIADAQNEANRLLSESDVLRQVNNEAEKIKEQVIAECEEIRKQAQEVAESIINRAVDEAARVKEGADVYAEDLLANLEQNLLKLQKEVKNGQIYIEKARLEANSGVSKIYPQQHQQQSNTVQNGNFSIE